MRKLIFIFLLGALFVQSCKNNTAKDSTSQSVSIGVMSSMDYLPLAIAEREGYFKEEGIDVKIEKFYSANERDAAFQSGNIDGTVIDYTGAVLQKAGGIPLKLVSKCDAPFYIVASKESGINDLSGLRGKQVAVSQNTVIDYCVDMALKSVGLTGKDIKKVEINKIPVRYEMLVNNKIDATGLPNPIALKAENEGGKILVSNDSLKFAITGIMFKEEALTDKAESIKKMYKAYNKGVDYILAHNVNDYADILKKDLGFTDDILPRLQMPVYTKAVMPSDQDIQSVVDWLVDRGLVKPDFDKSLLIDNQILAQ
ncbi:ABC transporter substrate-binding protein [Dysgonomonas sp. 520]|uniref:ABC transporter substrate-binding protein n=1 Tax=Dysgonomonas sp. 520 TaxID=2302931 RepID=UPI0013D55EAA|nr:ABC transporter substrate-binding protein [Dysgonomonas sp. 520]NDW09568.1 ABC transporter substrate-binding protein [Dysgonomonas sp. 520]